MKELIEALQILSRHMTEGELLSPTHCEHDVLLVSCETEDLPEEDAERLDELGFFFSSEFNRWASFRFGSS